MICKKCAAPISDTAKFCEGCGAPVAQEQAEPQAEQPLGQETTHGPVEPKKTPRWQLVVLAVLAIISIVLYIRGGQAVRTYFETWFGRTILYAVLFAIIKVCWDSAKDGGWRRKPLGLLLSIPIAAFCLYLLAYSSDSSNIQKGASVASVTSTVHEALLKDSYELNKKLPMLVDESLRIDSSHVVGKTLVYNATLLQYASRDVTQQDLYATFYKPQLARICSAPNIKALKRLHVTMQYVYFGKDNGKIGTVSIDPSSCQ